MNKYKNVISLGFFCSTALELKKIGLRDSSGPFDWIISDFKGIIDCIDNGFEDILKYGNMSQYKETPNYYVDTIYNFHFYHDFSRYDALSDQLPNVKDKYVRRIKRFYEKIKEPTLFIRYIKNQEEIIYIENNYEGIMSIIKKYNESNDLILISNDNIISNSLHTFRVQKDEGDSVARNFLDKNIELKNFLCSDIYDKDKRSANLQVNDKNKQFQSYLGKFFSKIKRKLKSPYVHNSTWKETM
ncbi:DUF1796 family putative cysteine peptidase [Bacillus sp. AFS031507]|uniref:DUF1796 family putative cysteine peptidase n=1 Tax=Bacillus sp. AFS031507 TaxID=2033496 RepID=UPI000BFC2B45|nr:DUF1796 family putative cysteine peptidase [Bacillus sp. AFS031507]PGY12671.1 hypothetical protein COE25_09925 [Bacillus sp. AFS031507]